MICAPTDEEADYLATSTDLGWVRLHRREFSPLPSPEEARAYEFSPAGARGGGDEPAAPLHRHAAEGGEHHPPDAVEVTEADEIMVTSMIYGRAERRRSYELLAAEWGLR